MGARRLQDLSPVGRIGRYDILGRLATGGMAEIFLARETGPHSASRELVLKRVLPHVARDEKLSGMFQQEARLCMRLRHPNICPIYEFGDEEGRPYLAMEWVDGVSLARMLTRVRRRGGVLPVPLVVRVVAQIAGALHHAHTARGEDGAPLGIVHRDVTPENIIVGYDGVTRLLDFGIAKASTQLDKTQAGELKGKFAYMSPEQYQGHELDARSDVFSLGVCLFEGLTGRSLYARESEYETVAAIVLDTAVPSIRAHDPGLPDFLDRVVAKALAKARQDRYPDADSMQADLERYLSSLGQPLRDSDIAAYVDKLFAEERAAGPRLDRAPLEGARVEQTGAHPLDELERLAIGVEADGMEEALAARGRRKTRSLVLLVLLLVLGVAGVTALVLREKPPGADPPRPSLPEPQSRAPGSSEGS